MNANLPIRAADPWAGYPDDDEGMPSLEERIRRSKRNMAMIAELPPLPEPSPEEVAAAEQRADDAVRSLIAPLLNDAELSRLAKGQRKFAREMRK